MTDVADQIEKARSRRFRPYPEYRDSGVEWLGEIPAHWNLERLKNCVARLESGGTPESDNVAYWTDEEHGIPWVAISDMTRDFHLHVTAKRITEKGRMSKRLRILPVGTLLYSMYASLGKVALLETEAVINQAILGVVPRESAALRDYLRWWFEFIQAHVQVLSASNTQDNLSAERVRNMPVVRPVVIEEQHTIAAILDRETAKIDGLVADKERLIDLLQEKRTALITRAVTRGLDPDVPMKDSGVEWLGEIPAHWEARSSRSLFRDVDRRSETGEEELLTVSHLTGVTRRSEKNVTMIEALSHKGYKICEPGELVVNTLWGWMGALGIAWERGIVRPAYNVYRVNASLQPRFVDYYCRTPGTVCDITRHSKGVWKSRLRIYPDDFREVLVVVPPRSEQEAIAAFLDRETAKIDALIDKVHQAIDRLKEFRTGLISAAVTGKIDVREDAA